MMLLRWTRFLGTLLVFGALSMTLLGCADDGAPPATGGDETVIVNPTPEALEPESGEMDY